LMTVYRREAWSWWRPDNSKQASSSWSTVRSDDPTDSLTTERCGVRSGWLAAKRLDPVRRRSASHLRTQRNLPAEVRLHMGKHRTFGSSTSRRHLDEVLSAGAITRCSLPTCNSVERARGNIRCCSSRQAVTAKWSQARPCMERQVCSARYWAGCRRRTWRSSVRSSPTGQERSTRRSIGPTPRGSRGRRR
jgi:hypothetical protein